MKQVLREYYKIHLLDKIGTKREWHRSMNGHTQWKTLGIAKRTAKDNRYLCYEIVKFTEIVEYEEEVVFKEPQ